MINIIKKHHKKVILTVPILFLMISMDSTIPTNSVFLKPSTFFPEVGSSFTVDLDYLTNKPFNATEGIIDFPKNIVLVSKLDISNTSIDLWGVEPEWSNSNGIVVWSGGIITPQYIDKTQKGSIMKMWMTPLQSTPFYISIREASLLESNGKANNLLENIYNVKIVPRPRNTPTPDIDGDSKLTTKDITQVILAISKPYNKKFDINNDKIITYKDANQMITYYNEINKK